MTEQEIENYIKFKMSGIHNKRVRILETIKTLIRLLEEAQTTLEAEEWPIPFAKDFIDRAIMIESTYNDMYVTHEILKDVRS